MENQQTKWFYKSKEDLKLVFVDCETHFTEVGTNQQTWKYKTPILRLITWMTWDGAKLSEPVTRDARFFEGDAWQDIRALLEEGYILLAYNTQFDIQPALCGNWILPFIFNGQVLDIMTNEIILSGYNPLCHPYNRREIEKALDDISNEEIQEDEIDEDGEIDNIGKQFRLADCAWLYCGVKLDKKWQHPDTYYNDIIDPAALEYASEDVLVLAPIFFKQLELIKEANLGEAIELKTELLATSYIYEYYGLPIDTTKLQQYRVDYHQEAERQKLELLEIFPKVMPSRTDCVGQFKKKFEKVKSVKGVYNYNGSAVQAKSLGEIEESIKFYYRFPNQAPNEHVQLYHAFIRDNKASLERVPNLGYHADLKQSFKKLGYALEKTDKFALAKLALTEDVKEAIKLLDYKKVIRLIQGTLNTFTYGNFLKSDDTVRPKARWNASKNFRAGMSDPNLLACPAALKGMLSVPAGMVATTFDLCLHPTTELLTDSGWKFVTEISDQDLVWEVDHITLEGSFVKPSRIIKQNYSGDFYWYNTVRGCLGVTAGHKMLYSGQITGKNLKSKDRRYIGTPEDGIFNSSMTMLTSTTGHLKESNYSEKEIWIAALIAADSCMERNRRKEFTGKYRIEVSKERKIKKIEELLGRKANNVYPPRLGQNNDSHIWANISFESELLEGKNFNLASLGANQASIFLEALKFWDGSDDHGRVKYSTSKLEEADAVQKYFVTSGYECRIRPPVKFDNPNWNTNYNLIIGQANGIRLRQQNIVKQHYEGLVGCVTVPKGFILVRSSGQTFITGNCGVELQYLLDKYQPPEAMKLLDAEDQHLFCASRYFDRDYEELLQGKHVGDKGVKRIRNLSKTTTYFGIYKSNANPKAKSVSGVNRLIESVRSQLRMNLDQEEAKKLILNSQKFFSTWSETKDKVESWILNKYRTGNKIVTFTSDYLNFKSNYKIEYLYDAELDYTNPRPVLSCMIAGNITLGTQMGIKDIQKYLFKKYHSDNARLNLYWHDSITIFSKPEIAFKEKETILKMFTELTFKYSGMKNTYLDVAGSIYDRDGNIYSPDGLVVPTEIRKEIVKKKDGTEKEEDVIYYYDAFSDNWTKEYEERYRYDKDGAFERVG